MHSVRQLQEALLLPAAKPQHLLQVAAAATNGLPTTKEQGTPLAPRQVLPLRPLQPQLPIMLHRQGELPT